MKKEISIEHQRKLVELGCYLRELRFSFGLTLADVSNDIDLHKNTIARVEHGGNIAITSLLILAKYYGIELSQLFTDTK